MESNPANDIQQDLYSIADSVRIYKLPIIICTVGMVLCVFIFLLMVQNNMGYQERNFNLVSKLEGKLIKSRLLEILETVSASSKEIESRLMPNRVVAPQNKKLALIPEIKSAYLLKLTDKVEIKQVIYQGADSDYIQRITKEVIYSDYLKNTVGQFIFLPTGAALKILNFTSQHDKMKQDYLVLTLPFAKYGKPWVAVYVVDVGQLVNEIVKQERKNTDFGSNIFLIRKHDDYSFGVIYEYYDHKEAGEISIDDKFSIYRRIGHETFDNETDMEFNGQKFSIIHVPTNEYLSSAVNLNIWLTLLSLVVIIMLISYFLFYLITRNQRIQEVVKLRTKELLKATEDLAQKNDELIEINKELEDFTYIVSHDIRSPLINLRGFSDEINLSAERIKTSISGQKNIAASVKTEINDIVDNEIGESVDYINKAVKSLDGMTSSILEFSRIGKISLRYEELNLRKIIDDVLSRYSHQIKSKNIIIRIGKLPDIVSDFVSMREIFSNIIDNAIKYMPDNKTGRIEIAGKSLTDSRYAMFSIKDNGPGISPEAKKKVFQILRRATLDKSIPGHGMGMPFVKAILKKLHGRIWFKSQEGKGTTFYFVVPNIDYAEQEQESTSG